MWKKFDFLLVVLLILTVENVFSQTKPFFLCISRQNDGSTELFWKNSGLGGTVTEFKIMGQTPNGSTLTEIKTAGPTETSTVINDPRYFRFQVIASLTTGVTVSSNILSHEEKEVVMITSSIENGELYLEWHPYNDGVNGVTYSIYEKTESGNNLVLDRYSDTTVTIPLTDITGSSIFFIVATDRCNNKSIPFYFNFLFLENEEPDRCTQKIPLFWNKYLLEDGNTYQIQENIDGVWETIDGSIDQKIPLDYSGRTEMTIRILYESKSGLEIHSNVLIFNDLPEYTPLGYIGIESIAFNDQNDATIVWESLDSSDVEEIKLIDVDKVWDISIPEGYETPFVVTGSDILPAYISDLGKEVKLRTNDVCDKMVNSAAVAWPFLVSEELYTDFVLTTIKSIYGSHQVKSYRWFLNDNVLDETQYDSEKIQLASGSLSGGQNRIYTEIIADFSDSDGNTKEVVFRTNTVELTKQSSFPNVLRLSTAVQTPILPLDQIKDVEDYRFSIFHRNGHRLFTTDDPRKSWIPEEMNTPATLVYMVYVKRTNKEATLESGTITVID